MLGKVRAADKGLPTLLTLIGLLPGVDLQVSAELGAAAEGLSTLLTLIGLLATVTSLMMSQL